MAFLGGWMTIMRIYMCVASYLKMKIDSNFRFKLDLFFLIMAIMGGLSSYAETTQRLNDYIVFLVPRVSEGFWDLFERLNYVKSFKHSEKLIFVLSMTSALYIKRYCKNSIPKNYQKIIDFVYGKN